MAQKKKKVLKLQRDVTTLIGYKTMSFNTPFRHPQRHSLTRLSGLFAIKTIHQLLREGHETDPVYQPLTRSSRQGFLAY